VGALRPQGAAVGFRGCWASRSLALVEPTVIRSSSPFEVLALAERTLGFRPRESLVVVSLRPPRWRSGLVARADLADVEATAPDLAQHLRADGAGRAFVAVVTDRSDTSTSPARSLPSPVPSRRSGHRSAPLPTDLRQAAQPHDRLAHLPGADAAHLVAAALREEGVQPELWLVHRGRLLSYTCERPCCPREGLPMGEVDSTRVAAEMVLAGRALAGDREEWEAAQLAAVAPADPGAVAAVGEQLDLVDRRWRRWERDTWAEPGAEPPVVALGLWRGLVEVGREGAAAGPALGPEPAAVLLDALRRVPVRDAVLGAVVPEAGLTCPSGSGSGCGPDGADGACPLCPPATAARTGAERDDEAAAAVRLLQHLARLAPPGHRAAPLGCAAYVLWARGASAPAGLLAELALHDDPGHSLSGLVLQSVRLGVAPPSVQQARRAG